MGVEDELRHVADLRFAPEPGKHVRRDCIHHSQRPEQAERRVAIVEGAFVARAVLAIVLEKGIEAVRRFGDDGAAHRSGRSGA